MAKKIKRAVQARKEQQPESSEPSRSSRPSKSNETSRTHVPSQSSGWSQTNELSELNELPGSVGPSVCHRNIQDKPLMRFYEPLVLLHTLSKRRCERTPKPEPYQEGIRKRFLTNLAYACDFDKGGRTVTAIGVQHQPQGPTYWVASNSVCYLSRIQRFLSDVLNMLSEASITKVPSSPERIDQLASDLIKFSNRRIKSYRKLLMHPLSRALSNLAEKEDILGIDNLIMWLEQWQNKKDPFSLCRSAYNERKSMFMQQLTELGDQKDHESGPESIYNVFHSVRHFIGRLGHHFRVATELLGFVNSMAPILTNYEVRIVPPMRPVRLPEPDSNTRLDSILIRMRPKDSPDLEFYRAALEDMDSKFGLTERFLDSYQNQGPLPDGASRQGPCVHAEVQVLEHFFREKLDFLDDDRFIAISKPSCYCCHLYFWYHPSSPAKPATHGNIYLNWRPPQFDDTGLTRIHPNQRRTVLMAMGEDIRKEALHQIENREPHRQARFDSSTGITISARLAGMSIGNMVPDMGEERIFRAQDLSSVIGDEPNDATLSDWENSDCDEDGGVWVTADF